MIKRLARKRFLLGYPPRKNSDTSIGDALNWEWIVSCGTRLNGEIVIVSRDSDYGISVKSEHFLNDQLAQEYRERVGYDKQISFTTKLSEALRKLSVQVSKEEEDAESVAVEKLRTMLDPISYRETMLQAFRDDICELEKRERRDF
jgi:hypothetical protein